MHSSHVVEFQDLILFSWAEKTISGVFGLRGSISFGIFGNIRVSVLSHVFGVHQGFVLFKDGVEDATEVGVEQIAFLAGGSGTTERLHSVGEEMGSQLFEHVGLGVSIDVFHTHVLETLHGLGNQVLVH